MFNMRDKYMNILRGHYGQQHCEMKHYVPQNFVRFKKQTISF